MDGFTFDFTNSDGLVAVPPTTEIGAGGETIFDSGIGVGNPTGGVGGGFLLPTTIGTNEYILTADVGTNSLVWVSNEGGQSIGDIVNGGQIGPISVGTTDATTMNIISGGAINIGATGSADQIAFNGSVGFQYDNISGALGTLTLNADYFFVEVTNAGTTEVALPDANTAVGRQYLISKGFAGGTLTITTTESNTIDEVDDVVLSVQNQRIQLISNGTDKWFVM
jgi:hypothetical protein